MSSKRKVCVFTAARSDYFLLRPLLNALNRSDQVELQLVVGGMHLSKSFGETWKLIEQDNIPITEKISMLNGSNNEEDVVASVGQGMIHLSKTLKRLKPDIGLLLGDRFEMLSFASACHLSGIPLAHIHGGELTYGAFDDAIRHCITKLSSIHFPATEAYRKRIIQMGEQPDTVFNVGALAVDTINQRKNKQSLTEIGELLKLPLSDRYFLVTLHPETRGSKDVEHQIDVTLKSLEKFPKHQIIWTIANADPLGQQINNVIKDTTFCKRVFVIDNLGDLYTRVLEKATAIIGNSSSGIIEAPILKVPTVNIGCRQDGRLRTPSIIDCDFDEVSLFEAIKKATSSEFRNTIASQKHPYGEGNTVNLICKKIVDMGLSFNRKKYFYDTGSEINV